MSAGKQLEVNSQVSSVVKLDDDSNDDAESITFQIPNPKNAAKRRKPKAGSIQMHN